MQSIVNDLASESFCDANYNGYEWVENDLHLFLEIASSPYSKLKLSWAANLILKIDPVGTGNRNISGPLLTIDGTLEQLESKRWFLQLNFGADGYFNVQFQDVIGLTNTD